MQLLKQHVEALIFTAEQPISREEILSCLKTVYGWEPAKDELLSVIAELKEKYDNEEYSFELLEIAEGYQFFSKKEYHTAVNTLLQIKARKRLSTAALETLAIIAYKQPISKSEIEHIRGVNCDYSIQKLLEKELIYIQGKGDGPGKPLLYGTSKNFMDHFGLKSVKELPKLKDLHIAENEIGIPSDLVETTEVPIDTEDGEIMVDPDAVPASLSENQVNTDELPNENLADDNQAISLSEEEIQNETPMEGHNEGMESDDPDLEQHLQNGARDQES